MNITPKPRISPARTSGGALKWRCRSHVRSESGRVYERAGEGHSPIEAFGRWLVAARLFHNNRARTAMHFGAESVCEQCETQ